MVKSIIKRIIVAVSVALILMMLKGSLIANVHASEVISIETESGNNFSSCTNCSTLTHSTGLASYIKNKSGTLYMNILVYSDSDANSFIPTLSRVRVKAHNETYTCFTNGQGYSYETNGSLNRTITSYSAFCPMTFDSTGGIQEIFIQTNGNGTGGISLYSPMTFVVDSNNQEIIDSQKVCKKYDKNSISINDKFLSSSGTETSSSSFGISKFIKIDSSSIIKVLVTQNSNASTCFYNVNKSIISCIRNNTLILNQELTIPNNSNYVRFSINPNANEPQFEICDNGNQAVANATDNLNDTLNDNNISSETNSSIDNVLTFGSESETFGPVADLLLLPLTLFRAFYSGFNGTCSSFNLGSLFGHQIVLPCINLQNILGFDLYSIIDVAISLFMIFNIVMMCIDIFDRITSFEDPFNELYSPKHTYHPKHGGDN